MENEIKLLNQDGKVVVSSRVVAKDFGKRHDSVLRNIETLIAEMNTPQFCGVFIESQYKASNGKVNKEYLLTRDGFSLLVMGFTGKEALQWKLKYIEAFNKMEEMIKNQVPQLTHKQQLQLTILNGSDVEKVLALKEYEEVLVEPYKQVIEEQRPDVEFAKAIKVSDTNLSIGNFSKQTNLGRNELFKFLRENKILFYDNGNNVPYQKYIKQGYFKCTQTVTNNHINVTTKITPKGQEWLFKKFNVLKRDD